MWGIHYFFSHLNPAIGQTSPEFQRCCDFEQMLSIAFTLVTVATFSFCLFTVYVVTLLCQNHFPKVSPTWYLFCSLKSAPL